MISKEQLDELLDSDDILGYGFEKGKLDGVIMPDGRRLTAEEFQKEVLDGGEASY